MLCGCAPDKLCDACLHNQFMQLKGVAACRGDYWARDLAMRVRWQPWPVESEKMLAIARVKVEDIARDERLRELLAAELVTAAAKRWRCLSAARSLPNDHQ